MTKYKNLFLRQSYLDAYEEYIKTLNSKKSIVWDYVIITASNESQAEAYHTQIQYRLDNHMLTESTHYAIVSDPDGKRVGSGGATLNVLKYIREQSSTSECFTDKRILIIHSGGDSKRVPQYSVCGKLFSPVPRKLPNGRRSTLFDELIIAMSGIPARMKDGMLVLSGDVLLLFNPLQIDFHQKGAAAFTIREDVKIGKNHGVFLKDDQDNVSNFLHKMSVEILHSVGAIDEQNNVNIDTGAVIFDSSLLNDLFGLISTNGNVDSVKYNTFVNEEVRLSFYGDFLYPLASKSTLAQYYQEKSEGVYSNALKDCRTVIWNTISKYNMKLLCLSPAEFIHFGTTRELLHLIVQEIENYIFLDWSSKVNTNITTGNYAANNSYIDESASIADGCYIEDSYIFENVSIGKYCVISNVTLRNVDIPPYAVLHGLKLKNGKFVVRKYGVDDNPKENNLWNKNLYPVCDTIDEAVNKTLSEDMSGELMSLCTSFDEADVIQILSWQNKLDDKVKTEKTLIAIRECLYVENVKSIFGESRITDRQYKMLMDIAETSDFSTKMRIYYYLSHLIKEEKELLENLCFKTIQEAIFKNAVEGLTYHKKYKIGKDTVQVRLPLRVNWGGGWSDTPPYCNEHGGTVLNAAIKVRGSLPVEVKLKKLDELKVVFESSDSGAYGEFTDIKVLQDCNDPFDPFALHKAALIACGIIPIKEDIPLKNILERLGGGIYLSTCVINIPRGSGLGTSSILGSACVKGIFEFLGETIYDNDLYTRVLNMEQIMSTGGGWQDQVGGLTPGIKLVTSSPGLRQIISCESVRISPETLEELQERFCLIYTGQRRLARNLLREVIGGYIGSNPNTIEVLNEIQRLAVLMRFELEKGNINGFAKLLDNHWELSKQLDSGCTNTCIEHIFMACEDMLAGKMICGAGGGGFLQVVLKRGYSINDLREQLKSVFGDTGVDVWECEFTY